MKAASTSDLVRCAAGAAGNAQGLLDDAELLALAGRHARAYALAALALEEAGKAVSLFALGVMPASLRARAPVGRMLDWHQLKLVNGLLICAVPPGSVVAGLAAMPLSQVAAILADVQVLAEDADRLKQRGLYADMERSGQVRLPSEVTDADVAAQLGRARPAVSSASVLLDPGSAARIANPAAELIEFCRALVSAFAEAGSGRTPEAAAEVVLNTERKLRPQMTAPEARASSGPRPAGDVRVPPGLPYLPRGLPTPATVRPSSR